MTASLKRIGALIVKELHQVVRDPGNVGIAVILPAVLLLLFGYGMSMDIKTCASRTWPSPPPASPRTWKQGLPFQIFPDHARLLYPGG